MNSSNKKYFFLGGVPRSGSTLLCSILGQNPEIYTSGTTIVAGVLWNNYHLFSNKNIQQYLNAQHRQDYEERLMKASIDAYYSITNKKYVIDKSRTWTLNGNKLVLEKYIDKNPKILVTTRNAEDVFKSLLKIYEKNKINIDNVFDNFWKKDSYGSVDFFKSYAGLMSAYLNNQNNNYLFIDYEDIVGDSQKTIKNIYKFFDIEYFYHDFDNIEKNFKEDDLIWNLNGLHDVRNKIKKINNDIELPHGIREDCEYIQKLVCDAKNGINLAEVNSFININGSLQS